MNAPTAASSPLPRVAPNLAHAFGGVWRLTLRRFLTPQHGLVLGGMMLLLLPFYAPVTVTEVAAQHDFMIWTIGKYLTTVVPILAFISAGGALRDEMKAGTADYVFTRPIPRWAFLGFKYVSHLVCAQIDFLIALGAVYALGHWRHVPGLDAALPSLIGAQFLVVMAFSALGFLAATITSKYIIVGLAYGSIIEVGIGQIPTQLSRLSMTHQVQVILQRFIPIDPAKLADPLPTMVVAQPGVFTTAMVLVMFSALILTVAAVIFSFLELISAEDA